jgi:hypothetical protein
MMTPASSESIRLAMHAAGGGLTERERPPHGAVSTEIALGLRRSRDPIGRDLEKLGVIGGEAPILETTDMHESPPEPKSRYPTVAVRPRPGTRRP